MNKLDNKYTKNKGIIYLQNLIPKYLLDEAHDTLLYLIELQFKTSFYNKNLALDELIFQLALQDRNKVAYIYNAFKDSVIFSQICQCQQILKVANDLLKSKILSSPSNHWVFRIDLPNESQHSFNWHYDLAYNMMGTTSLTFWLPLTNISFNMGSVVFSHYKDREILPVGLEKKFNGNYNAFISNIYHKQLEDHSYSLEVNKGDCIIFDAITAHKSGLNQSKSARLSIQVRFTSFDNQQYLKQNWLHRKLGDQDFSLFRKNFSDNFID